MIELLNRLPTAKPAAGFLYCAGLMCSTLALILAGANAARAQLTSQALIGDAVSPDSISRHTDVDEAIKRFLNRDILAAHQFLEAAKKKDPNLPPVDLLVAKMYFLSGNATAGRISLERTALENPDDPEAYLIIADQAMQQGRTIEADALYERALELTAKFSGNAKRKRNFEILRT